MNKINLLIVVMLWVTGHLLIYTIHSRLMEVNIGNIPFLTVLFLLAVFAHYRLATHMTSKVSTYL
jgi:hypothetical protein